MNTTQPELKIKSDEELINILKNIVNPKYESHVSDWVSYAKPNEKKGLYIISKVIKHKGQKIFKVQLTKTKEEENDINTLTIEEAYKRYQSKKTVSSYTEFYGGNLDEKYKYNNIFKFKEFQNLNYADLIKSEYYTYISNWVHLEKSEQYKEYILDFLRSFLSTVRANRKFITHNYDVYQDFKRNDKFTSHAPHFLNKHQKYEERVPTYEEMRARLNLDAQKFAESQSKSFSTTENHKEEIEKRKRELTLGTKNLLKGIFPNTTSTVYQEVFKGAPLKHNFSFKTDPYSSGIKGILPDPFVMKRLKSESHIDDNLKNTVQTLMFADNYNKYR